MLFRHEKGSYKGGGEKPNIEFKTYKMSKEKINYLKSALEETGFSFKDRFFGGILRVPLSDEEIKERFEILTAKLRNLISIETYHLLAEGKYIVV